MIKKAILLALLIVFCFALAGCQTVAGFGGDIEWTAEKTSDWMSGE